MTLYLDASAIVPVVVGEPAHEVIDRFLATQAGVHVVTAFAAGEVASAISRLVRMNHLTIADGREALADFDAWRLTDCSAPPLDMVDILLAGTFVRRFELKLRLPDAIHAACCYRLGLTLATLDIGLANAATVLGIAVIVPE